MVLLTATLTDISFELMLDCCLFYGRFVKDGLEALAAYLLALRQRSRDVKVGLDGN